MPEDYNIFINVPELLYVTPQDTNIRRIQRPLHQHEDVSELLFVYHGNGKYICDGYVYDISAGDFLFTNQGDMHEVQSATELEIGTFCFGMSKLQLVNRAHGVMCSREEGYVRRAGEHQNIAAQLCRSIYHFMACTNPQERLVAQHMFLSLFLLALSRPADERSQHLDGNAALAVRMQQYITLHFAEPITLQSIADALHISLYYAAHIFKQQTGISPVQYMINCRIGEAQNLLISSDFSATQIGAMVGYSNPNHFNVIFKKKVGMPPVQYRKYYLEKMHGKRGQ